MAAAPDRPAGGGSIAAERKRYQARQRKRRQRDRERAEHGDKARRNQDIAAIIGKGRDDIIHEVMAEELRPVVREAIDQDAIRAIRGMVGLAPAAILVLAEGLESDDEVVRQRSAALIAKYTLGNPMVTPPRDDGSSGLVIINQLPRPGDAPVEELPPIEATAEELRRCDSCNLDKPLSEFPGDGPRCAQCLAEKKAQVIDAFLKPDERAALLSPHAVRQPAPATDVQRPSPQGGPEVHQAGAGLQSGDIRAAWTEQIRHADPSGHEQGSRPPGPQTLRGASGAFGGPPDPKRWSEGS